MSDELTELPERWAWRQINELCVFNPKHNKEAFDDLEISFVPMAAVDEKTGAIYKHDRKLLGEVRKGYTHFADGDVIFAKITPCMENGKSAVARDLRNGLACGSTEFHVLRSCDAVLPEYLHNFLRQEIYLHDAAGAMTGVVGQRRLPKEFLLGTKLPLPPLNEQRRVVTKIEALRVRSQQAKEALEAIRPLLDQFRQSVLAAAFRGDLTADWREQNPDVEPASVLLERIREKRRKQLDCKFKKLTNLDSPVTKTEQLPEIPDSWSWIYFGELITSIRSGSTAVPQDEVSDYPILRSSSVRPRVVDLKDIRFLTKEQSLSGNNFLCDGDLLFTRLSGSLDYVANCAVVRSLRNQYIQYPDRLFCAKLIDAKYANYSELCFASPLLRSLLTRSAKSSAGHQRVSMGAIIEAPIPLPPLLEQQEIVQRVHSILKSTTQIGERYRETTVYLKNLDQSILAKAFRGDLVPQDPNDEPASILLERIRAERAKKETEAKAAKTTGKTRGRRKIDEVDLSEQISLPGLE